MQSSYSQLIMPTPFVKRSTSPLEAEPLVTATEDVLWPASDAEDSAESHRNKRRRIEAQGKRYLEGKPLFIQSGGLRGPLDTGWINPWKRKPRRKRGGILRLPDKADIVDLTEPELQPFSPALDIRRRLALSKGVGARASVISDLGPQVAPAVEPAERRAKSNEVGGKPKLGAAIQLEVKALPPRSKDWLKSDTNYLKGGKRRISKSPTPTPTVRPWARPRTPVIEIVRRTPVPRAARTSPTQSTRGSRTSSANASPVNDLGAPEVISDDHGMTTDVVLDPVSRADERTNRDPVSSPKIDNVSYSEVDLDLVDGATKLGFHGAKALAEAALRKAQDEEGHREARRLSQQAAFLASQASSAPESPQLEEPKPPPAKIFRSPYRKGIVSREVQVIVEERRKLKSSKDTPRAIPPSSNLDEFKYRIPRKEVAKRENLEKQSPFAQQLQAAKAKAEAKTMKHLSFTSSGAIRSFGSPSTSRASSAETARSRLNHEDPTSSQEDSHRKSRLSQITSAFHTNNQYQKLPSNVLPQGPEAQAAQPLAAPSGPSTNVLETDKQSLKFLSTEEGEGDSYVNLSTQAALSKAQQSFQDSIRSPLKHSPNRNILSNGSQPSPTAYKTPNANLLALPVSLGEENPEGDHIMTPSNQVPNTQAMLDAISPFAMTTVKKKQPSPIKPTQPQKRASFAHSPLLSPSHTFGTTRRSLSMSTSSGSPSPAPIRRSPKRTPASNPPPILSKTSTNISKPLSTATSNAFSIAPNGTLTEVYQQDGQQQNNLAIAIDSGWDLDQALEEAGSFLETLDVEAEVRKGGTRLVNGNKG